MIPVVRIGFIVLLFYAHDMVFANGLTEANLELKRMPFQRDYFFKDQEDWGYEISLKLKYQKRSIFLESDITGQTFDSRFRNVWWDYTVGVKVTSEIDIVWDHRSQHALDLDRKKFPVRDSYGIRLNLLK